jgi:PAS domain S-box-containing protein
MRREVEAREEVARTEAPGQSECEEALNEWMAFRALIELAPDAVLIGDGDYRVTEVNTAACTMLRCGPEELIGHVLPGLEPEEAARFHRECPSRPGAVHVGEWRVRRCDGTFVPVEASVTILPDGRSVGFVRDITQRKRTERERDESLRWARAVLEQSPVGLALVRGARGERVEFNARAQQLLGPPEAREREITSRLRTLEGRSPAIDEMPIVAALRGERLDGGQFLARNAEGGHTPIAVGAAPIVGADGEVLGAVAAFEDISAAKELERLRTEWSSVVAHDLQQPLAAISANAQMLARETEDPTLLKGIDRIRAAAQRLSRMVGDLMDLSRLEASRLELVRQNVDVTALVRAAAERAELETPERPFEVRVHGSVKEAYADPDRIAQVMENLLTNAIKYGRAGTPIVMSVAQEGDEVAVAVINEGRALDAQEMARIFERFQRTASAKLEGIQGVGLGLYITRSLVEAHGGRVTAESTTAGVTTFRFTLPVASP